MKLIDPVSGIGEKKLSYGTGRLTVEVDGLAPLRAVTVREVFRGEALEVIPIGPDVVIDDIQDHSQPYGVRPIHETATIVGRAVEVRWRKQINAIITPAETTGKL